MSRRRHSAAGKGGDLRPVDRKKWNAGWAGMTVECPDCLRPVMRRESGVAICPRCGKEIPCQSKKK